MKPDRRHSDLSRSGTGGSPQKRGRAFTVVVGLAVLVLGGYWAMDVVGTFRPGAIQKGTLTGPIAELDGRDTGKRRLAAMTLEATNLDLRPAVPALTRALSDDDKVVRKYAALALAKAGESAQPAIPALRTCLNDPDSEVAEAARRALKEIQKDEIPKDARPD
jgi:hypothetical protein